MFICHDERHYKKVKEFNIDIFKKQSKKQKQEQFIVVSLSKHGRQPGTGPTDLLDLKLRFYRCAVSARIELFGMYSNSVAA